ncbi:MAG: transposase [Phycisphaerae bacterium]|nr:transposase [Phycisphaerales bacterium]
MPKHLRRYDEPGDSHFLTISCQRRLTFFHDDTMKQIVVDGLRILQERFKVCVVGYVIMPEHVHVILYPHARGGDAPVPISKLLYAFKKHVGFHGKQRLREIWREVGRLWSEPLNAWATGDKEDQTIWNVRGYDFNVRHHKALLQKLDYCHKNPITRGLVDRAEDWAWSSYRYYELGDESVLKMDWDGAWPIEW